MMLCSIQSRRVLNEIECLNEMLGMAMAVLRISCHKTAYRGCAPRHDRAVELDWKRSNPEAVVGRIRWNEGVGEKMKVVTNANGLKEFR